MGHSSYCSQVGGGRVFTAVMNFLCFLPGSICTCMGMKLSVWAFPGGPEARVPVQSLVGELRPPEPKKEKQLK